MAGSVPILLYHHVSPDREITPEGFERQLRYLLEQGYQSLSMSEVLAFAARQSSNGQRGFAVTLDDGYLDNWIYAFPILQKLAVKATLYLVTERLERCPPRRSANGPPDTRSRERAPGGFLSWPEVRAMADSGLVEIGSHTHTHRNFVRASPYGNLEGELRLSKQLIEKETGRPCLHLAWPWGDYEKAWWPLLERTGYATAVTTLPGANTSGTPPFALKRIPISRPDLDWFASRCRWHSRALAARSFALFYGWDRRFKNWRESASPYSHG